MASTKNQRKAELRLDVRMRAIAPHGKSKQSRSFPASRAAARYGVKPEIIA
jgi:hypothetical protein